MQHVTGARGLGDCKLQTQGTQGSSCVLAEATYKGEIGSGDGGCGDETIQRRAAGAHGQGG